MTDTRTGLELREAVARALGWTPDPILTYMDIFTVPHFESSLDACFGPGGPVEVMRKMDFSPDQSIQDMVTWRADAAMEFVDQWPLYLTAEDYCRAFLAAMEGEDG